MAIHPGRKQPIFHPAHLLRGEFLQIVEQFERLVAERFCADQPKKPGTQLLRRRYFAKSFVQVASVCAFLPKLQRYPRPEKGCLHHVGIGFGKLFGAIVQSPAQIFAVKTIHRILPRQFVSLQQPANHLQNSPSALQIHRTLLHKDIPLQKRKQLLHIDALSFGEPIEVAAVERVEFLTTADHPLFPELREDRTIRIIDPHRPDRLIDQRGEKTALLRRHIFPTIAQLFG